MAKVSEIEGIGPVYSEKLGALGIANLDGLLAKGASRSGRKAIADTAGVSEHLVLEWVNRADLARVKGVGSEYGDLLEAAGVDSVPELAQRNAANLTAKMAEVNDAKHLVRRVPVESEVERWIEDAKSLERVVTH